MKFAVDFSCVHVRDNLSGNFAEVEEAHLGGLESSWTRCMKKRHPGVASCRLVAKARQILRCSSTRILSDVENNRTSRTSKRFWPKRFWCKICCMILFRNISWTWLLSRWHGTHWFPEWTFRRLLLKVSAAPCANAPAHAAVLSSATSSSQPSVADDS